MLLALTRPFNFTIFPDSPVAVLGALSGDEWAVRDPLAAMKMPWVWLVPGRDRLQKVSPLPGGDLSTALSGGSLVPAGTDAREPRATPGGGPRHCGPSLRVCAGAASHRRR